jgi:hypothetical protein
LIPSTSFPLNRWQPSSVSRIGGVSTSGGGGFRSQHDQEMPAVSDGETGLRTESQDGRDLRTEPRVFAS